MRMLGVSVGLLAVACGSNATTTDAGAIDAAQRSSDAQGPDAAVDATPSDAGPPPDASLPFEDTLGDPPYVVGDPAGTDLRDAVTGGVRPYACAFYEGIAPGTVPAGVSQDPADPTGCRLVGGVNPASGDLPGTYGFIVVMTDALGASLEIPVAYQGAPCGVAPAAWPVAEHAPGAAATWTFNLSDMDGVDGPLGCEPCMSVSALTRSPLAVAADLACANDGDVCSDCDDCIEVSGTCPGLDIATATRDITVRNHPPLRENLPGWVTVELSVAYSGGSVDPCGGKLWRCHIEALELPR